MSFKKISINSSEEIHKLLKVRAAQKGITIGEYIKQLVLSDVQKEEK